MVGKSKYIIVAFVVYSKLIIQVARDFYHLLKPFIDFAKDYHQINNCSVLGSWDGKSIDILDVGSCNGLLAESLKSKKWKEDVQKFELRKE